MTHEPTARSPLHAPSRHVKPGPAKGMAGPQNATLSALQKQADESAPVAELQSLADLQRQADTAPTPRPNNTGLPDNLKAGIESLSGMSMDHVRVHRNSDKPANVQAHAYAQGSDIHLGPGQEKHLPHEAWHVVQQAQGRVKPTVQLKGVAVNDDAGLEAEADVMGPRAMKVHTQKTKAKKYTPRKSNAFKSPTVQMKAEVKITKDGLELGREHDLKRYIELSFETSEKGKTQTEMKKQNTYRHMDSQATRRGAMANMMRYHLTENPIVDGAQELCKDLQPAVDTWENDLESEGGQFLGNAKRNSAISSEYDSLVLELLIMEKPVSQEAIEHDLMMNIRNTAFKIVADDDTENIPTVLGDLENEEYDEEFFFKNLLPVLQMSIESSVKLTAKKLKTSKSVNVKDLKARTEQTIQGLVNELRKNYLNSIDKFHDVIGAMNNVVPDHLKGADEDPSMEWE